MWQSQVLLLHLCLTLLDHHFTTLLPSRNPNIVSWWIRVHLITVVCLNPHRVHFAISKNPISSRLHRKSFLTFSPTLQKPMYLGHETRRSTCSCSCNVISTTFVPLSFSSREMGRHGCRRGQWHAKWRESWSTSSKEPIDITRESVGAPNANTLGLQRLSFRRRRKCGLATLTLRRKLRERMMWRPFATARRHDSISEISVSLFQSPQCSTPSCLPNNAQRTSHSKFWHKVMGPAKILPSV